MADLFTNAEAAAWGGLLSTHSRLFKQIEDNLRSTAGISHAEYEVLLRLFRSPEGRLGLQTIAEQSILSHSGTSRLVDRLEGAGYVERVASVDDGRSADVVLTEDGRAHFQATAAHHVALIRETFLRHFSEDELATMAGFWSRLDP